MGSPWRGHIGIAIMRGSKVVKVRTRGMEVLLEEDL